MKGALKWPLAHSFGDIWLLFTDPGKSGSPFWVCLFAKHWRGEGHFGPAQSKSDWLADQDVFGPGICESSF